MYDPSGPINVLWYRYAITALEKHQEEAQAQWEERAQVRKVEWSVKYASFIIVLASLLTTGST